MTKSTFAAGPAVTRRTVLTGLAAGAAVLAAPAIFRSDVFAKSGTIKLGAPFHRTGIGASYGRWYERTATAAVKLINEAGGINGMPIEMIVEDDGTDPKRGTEVIEKFAAEYKVDAVFGHLFSHVVAAAGPRAGELKLPYLVCSEGHQLASGGLNRYTFQPGITDVKSQVASMAPWISKNLGKKVTMIFPDYAFGHNHRDFFSEAIKALKERTGAARVALVGSSRGGNAIRNVVKNGGGADVSHAVLCGTPNHGVFDWEDSPGSEFNGRGPFLRGLNAGDNEVTEGTAFLTLRSDGLDKYAQADGRLVGKPGVPSGITAEGPALKGATNIARWRSIRARSARSTNSSPAASRRRSRFSPSARCASADW